MFKTGLLLAAITALFIGVGYLLGGEQGMVFAFFFALLTNFFSYWYSDKMVLSMYRARPVEEGEHAWLTGMVASLAKQAGIPMPRVYIMENPQPNAFATGRNPNHAAIAVTSGLLQILDRREVEAVLAHELGHVRNYDTLIMTVTATVAGAISALANFAMFFGGGHRSDGQRSNPVAVLLVAILAPIAAMLVQFAISRTREYHADKAGAEVCGDPLALASALRKISGAAARVPNPVAERNPATAHLFIVNPLLGRGVDNLFSTHPSAENRIRILEEMAGASPRTEHVAAPKQRPLRRGSLSFGKGPWG